MKTNLVKANIFLGGESGITETDWFRTRNLFNAGSYIAPHRQCFDKLYLLNEETLAPGRSLTGEVNHDYWLLLLPVWGRIRYAGSAHNSYNLQPGQLLWVPAPARHMYSVSNLEENENVHFVQLLLKQEKAFVADRPILQSMDASDYQNQLLSPGNADSSASARFYLGQFSGRKKGQQGWEQPQNVFVYCLQGALELEDRLLHAGDGIGLWQMEEMEWEALSQYALFLVVAFPSGN